MIQRLVGSAEWRFLASLWRADRQLATLWWVLVAVRGALPAMFAVTMGELVGAVQRSASLGPPLAAVAATSSR